MQLNQLPIFFRLSSFVDCMHTNEKLEKKKVKSKRTPACEPCSFLYFDFILHKRWHQNLQRLSILFRRSLVLHYTNVNTFVMNNTYIQLRMNSEQWQFFRKTFFLYSQQKKKRQKNFRNSSSKTKSQFSYFLVLRHTYIHITSTVDTMAIWITNFLDNIQIKQKKTKKTTKLFSERKADSNKKTQGIFKLWPNFLVKKKKNKQFIQRKEWEKMYTNWTELNGLKRKRKRRRIRMSERKKRERITTET